MTATCTGGRTWWVFDMSDETHDWLCRTSTDSDPTLLHRTISFPSMEPAFAYSRYFDLRSQGLTDDKYVLTDEGLVRIDWDKRSVKLVWKDSNPGFDGDVA